MMGAVVDRIKTCALLREQFLQPIVDFLEPGLAAFPPRNDGLVRDEDCEKTCMIESSNGFTRPWNQFESVG